MSSKKKTCPQEIFCVGPPLEKKSYDPRKKKGGMTSRKKKIVRPPAALEKKSWPPSRKFFGRPQEKKFSRARRGDLKKKFFLVRPPRPREKFFLVRPPEKKVVRPSLEEIFFRSDRSDLKTIPRHVHFFQKGRGPGPEKKILLFGSALFFVRQSWTWTRNFLVRAGSRVGRGQGRVSSWTKKIPNFFS